MRQRCKACGKELEDMPADTLYCSIECTYGIPSFKDDVTIYP